MQGKTLAYVLAFLLAGGIALLFSMYHLPDTSPKVGGNQPIAANPPDISSEIEKQAKNAKSNVATGSCPAIKSVTLLPERPTIHDDIKAKLSYEQDTSVDIKLAFKWFVNKKRIDDVTGDTLPASYFKKKDMVFVEVIPAVGAEQGFACRSSFKTIESTPVSLILKETNEKRGEVIRLQLIGNDPDGDTITYSLEQPILDGMTINNESGTITWKPSKPEIGHYKFNASATTSDGRKTVRIFEFKLVTK